MVRAVCFDLSGLDDASWRTLLEAASPGRKERANRCRKEETARQCIVAEVLLRYGLSRQYGAIPAYTLTIGESGKPMIPELPEFQFNLSHCGSWVVFAWSEQPVGIDVQRCSGERPALVRRHFTQREQDYISSGENASERTARFCRIWTAKESWLKYLGTGLTVDLRSFDTMDDNLPMRFHRAELPGGYTLCACSPCERFFVEQLAVWDLPGLPCPDREKRA